MSFHYPVTVLDPLRASARPAVTICSIRQIRRRLLDRLSPLLPLACCALAAQTAISAEMVRHPVLVELFTSEGCSSCPPADQLLATLDRTQPVAGADILVLSEHVDYWDSLGWKDPNSSPVFTLRQEIYARKLRVEDPYTPELVVDGRQELVGGRAEDASSAIAKAARLEKIPVHVVALPPIGNRARVAVTVEAGASIPHSAKIYIAVAANETRSNVGRGENAGRQLTHVGVVRTLDDVGPAAGEGAVRKEITLKVRPEELQNVRVVAFIQDSRSLAVLGAAALAR